MRRPRQGFLRKLWIEYCAGNSVYAMRHLVMEQLLLGERLWWFGWIGSCIAICLAVNVLSLRQWDSSPVVLSFDTEFAPIWAIPFPAVTICPQDKTRIEYLNVSDAFERLTTGAQLDWEYHRRLRTMVHVCPYMSIWYAPYGPMEEDCVKSLQLMAASINELFAECKWRGIGRPCSALFSQSITDNGICYTFNAISADRLFREENLQNEYKYSTAAEDTKDWNLEEGYRSIDDLNSHPLRAIGSGIKSGLFVIMRTRKIDEQALCNGPVGGHKVLLHSPDDVPSFEDSYYRLPSFSVLKLVIDPTLIFTSNNLRRHPFTRRQCYFSNERYLRYFRVYTQVNCVEECVANLTLENCGCVKFSMPRSANVPICDASDYVCYELSYYSIYNVSDQQQDACGCLPGCASIHYDVELSSYPFNFEALAAAVGLSSAHYDYISPSMLAIGYRSKWIIPVERRELMGLSDIIAKVGGLFGLMMGASVISILEIVYFCVVRPWRNDDNTYSARIRHVLPWRP